MSKPLYNYKLTFTPEDTEFNSRRTKPQSYTAFVYKVRNKQAALRVFMKCRLPQLRKNGLRAYTKTPVVVERFDLDSKVHN
jgi:hypothetical protein